MLKSNVKMLFFWTMLLALMFGCGSGGDDKDKDATLILNCEPTMVDYNGTATLSWESTRTDSCEAKEGWTGTKPISGDETVGPLTENSIFKLTCKGSGGEVAKTVEVTIRSENAPTVELKADPESPIKDEEEVTISWESTNATSCEAEEGAGGWAGPKEISGSQIIGTLSETMNFVMKCKGPEGSVTENLTVAVRSKNAPTVKLSAIPESVKKDEESVTLSWENTDTTSCEATEGTESWRGKKDPNDSQEIGTLSADTKFVLTCTGPDGEAKDEVTVTVYSGDESTVEITSDRSWVHEDDPDKSVKLSWTATNADDCQATGGIDGWPGAKDPVGKDVEFGPITETATFVLTCTGDEVNVEDSLAITFVPKGKGSAQLEWEPPMKGDEPEVFDGYRFEYGTASKDYTKHFEDDNTEMTTYLFEELDSGEWFFILKAYRNGENGKKVYSIPSNEASGLIMPSTKTVVGVQK